VKLSQSRGVLRIDSEILPDGVLYRERNLLSSNEVKIPFEQISDDRVRAFNVSRLNLIICAFFALAFGLRIYRFLSTDGVTVTSVVWAGIMFLVPCLGTWMQSPHYIGLSTGRGGLLFFEKKGAQDPTRYLEAIQEAKTRFLHERYRVAQVVTDSDPDSEHPAIH
jgi:hypothetical protein